MTFNEYQEFTRTTAIYPKEPPAIPIVYTALGLASEAGEVAGVIKKWIRDSHTVEEIQQKVMSEVGDVIWYCARILDEVGVDMESTVLSNVRKLTSRASRGVLSGSGDNR